MELLRFCECPDCKGNIFGCVHFPAGSPGERVSGVGLFVTGRLANSGKEFKRFIEQGQVALVNDVAVTKETFFCLDEAGKGNFRLKFGPRRIRDVRFG